MGKRTSYAPGTFCYVELGSTEPKVSADFYASVLGWELDTLEYGDGIYISAKVDGMAAAGVYTDANNAWITTISVKDCDASAKLAEELGATIIVAPSEADTMGRMCIVADPQGAVFTLWQARDMFGAEVVNQVGSFTMTQLNTQDPEKATDFYGRLFDWEFKGVGGDVEYWNMSVDGRLNAGMMKNPMPGPDNWLVYFTCSSLEGAIEKIGSGGGVVIVQPTTIPAGRFLVAQDPQGATFALFEGKVDD